MLGPTSFRGLCSHLASLFLRHGLEATLPADLTTFAACGSHVRGQVYRGHGLGGNYELIGLIFRGVIYNPPSELVWVARTFAFADCHREFLPGNVEHERSEEYYR
jgi:hypothetical protein